MSQEGSWENALLRNGFRRRPEEVWLAERDDRFAGRTPRSAEGLTIRILVNRFLTSKRLLVDSDELSPRTWSDYFASCESLVTELGKDRRVDELGSRDFELLRAGLAKRRGPVSLGNEIQRIRTLFKFAFDDGLIEKPVRFGATFKKPSRKVIRNARHAAGPRMIEAEDLRKLLGVAGTPLKAMILLGLNCGFGQPDPIESRGTARCRAWYAAYGIRVDLGE